MDRILLLCNKAWQQGLAKWLSSLARSRKVLEDLGKSWKVLVFVNSLMKRMQGETCFLIFCFKFKSNQNFKAFAIITTIIFINPEYGICEILQYLKQSNRLNAGGL